ncbi:hypothetical protein IWQ61_007191 [Dispira simplex]|nr:hypothetical protein IWQ61_007191 [Dispira simplex]
MPPRIGWYRPVWTNLHPPPLPWYCFGLVRRCRPHKCFPHHRIPTIIIYRPRTAYSFPLENLLQSNFARSRLAYDTSPLLLKAIPDLTVSHQGLAREVPLVEPRRAAEDLMTTLLPPPCVSTKGSTAGSVVNSTSVPWESPSSIVPSLTSSLPSTSIPSALSSTSPSSASQLVQISPPAVFYRRYVRLLVGFRSMDLESVWNTYIHIIRAGHITHLREATLTNLLRLIIRTLLFSSAVDYSFHLGQAWAVLHDFTRSGHIVVTQQETYHAIIQVLVLSKIPDAARRVYQCMLSHGWAPTLETFLCFMRVPRLQDERYLGKLFRALVEHGFQPTAEVYTIIAFAAKRNINMRTMSWVLHDMERRQVTPSGQIYAAQIQLLIRRNYRRKAYEALLRYLCSDAFRPPANLPHTLRTPSRGMRTSLFQKLVRNYLYKSPPSWAGGIIELMDDFGVEMFGSLFNYIIQRFVQRNDFVNAVYYYQMAMERGANLSANTFRGLAFIMRVNDSFELGWDLFTRTEFSARHGFSHPETDDSNSLYHFEPGDIADQTDLGLLPSDPKLYLVELDGQMACEFIPLFYRFSQYRAVIALCKFAWDTGVHLYSPIPSQMVSAYLYLDQKQDALRWYRLFLNRGIALDSIVIDQLASL